MHPPTIILGLPLSEIISHQDDSTNGFVNFKSGRWITLRFFEIVAQNHQLGWWFGMEEIVIEDFDICYCPGW